MQCLLFQATEKQVRTDNQMCINRADKVTGPEKKKKKTITQIFFSFHPRLQSSPILQNNSSKDIQQHV